MYPQEGTDGSEPFNFKFNSPLHLNQEEGFCITQNPNNFSIGNPVNCVREIHEAEWAGDQNVPLIDLTQLPDDSLMTRNVVGETFQTHAHPAVNTNNVNIGPTQSNSSRIPQTYTRSISGEGNAYNRFSPSLGQWHGMLGTAKQQIGIDMLPLGANMNSAYQIPAQQERITRTAGTRLGPNSSTFNGMHGTQIRRNVFTNGVNMNAADQNQGQQEQMVGIGGPNSRPNLVTARGGYRPCFDMNIPMVGAGTNSGYQNVDQELMLSTGVSNFSPTSTGLYGSQSDKSMVTAGANINLSYQNHDQIEQRGSSQVTVAVPFNIHTCHLTLGLGDDKLSTCSSGGIYRRTPSTDVIANNSSYSILGPQGDRNLLPLGKNFGDPNLLNNALNPTAVTDIFSLNTGQAPDVDLQHCYPIQGVRIPGSRINKSSKDINLDSSGQSQGYSDAASGQSVPIQAGLIANEQARRAVIERMSRSATQSHNCGPAPVYHAHMGNILTSNSKVFPSLGSTSGSGLIGQPVDLRLLRAQQATGGALRVSLTGKRSPVGGNMSQSVKLPRRPSAAGLPVPTGNRKAVTADPTTNKRVTKPVPVAIEEVVKLVPLLNKKAVKPVHVKPSGNTNPTSAITNSPLDPRDELAKLLSSLPSQEHIRWKDPVKSNHIIEENCGICKRNLLYAAKGDYVQPSLPPATAVLPCGHAYHDECLEGVTPLEQAKEPPCISCWISNSENP